MFSIDQLTPNDQVTYQQKLSKVLAMKDSIKLNPRMIQAESESYSQNLPRMIIIGAKKCGTGALARALAMHPLTKYSGESFYFHRHESHGLSWYADQMKASRPSDLPFEKTPIYIFSDKIAHKIKDFSLSGQVKNLKLINVMCDPIRRIYSEFLHVYRFNKTAATIELFEQAVDSGLEFIQNRQNLVNSGQTTWEKLWKTLPESKHEGFFQNNNFASTIQKSFYSLYLKEWYSLFQKDVEILNLDNSEFYTNPGQVLKQVENFLNLPEFINENNFFYNQNQGLFCRLDVAGEANCPPSSKGRSNGQEVPERIKQKLKQVIDPFTKELEILEGKSFAHWDW